MNIRNTRWATMTLAAAMMTVPACNEEPAAEGQDDNGEEAQCDPVGVDAERGMLLNAPLAADVEVIQKQPQHPGAPGPLGLP
jgi:hypothetical protein